jgi:hypothetical protein
VRRLLDRRLAAPRAEAVGVREDREQDGEQHDPAQQRPGVAGGHRGIDDGARGDRHQRLRGLVGHEEQRGLRHPPALPADRLPQDGCR